MAQRIRGTLFNAFTGEELQNCDGTNRIYRVAIWELAPGVDGDCWKNMAALESYKTAESIPFYTADYELPYLSPDVPYCYPCLYHLYAYADVKLGDKWIRYSTGVETIYVEENCDLTEDFYIPVSVPAPPGCDKLFVSNYGTVLSKVKEEELERAVMMVRERGEVKKYTTK